jgi:hypothetical protein
VNSLSTQAQDQGERVIAAVRRRLVQRGCGRREKEVGDQVQAMDRIEQEECMKGPADKSSATETKDCCIRRMNQEKEKRRKREERERGTRRSE